MKMIRKITALLLAVLLCAAALPAFAADDPLNAAADYVYRTVQTPQPGSVGGEWAVLGLARSGYAVPQSWYDGYYAALEKYVASCGGVLSTRKYTEYSRTIVGLAAMGRDARCVAGYDLTAPLGDYDKTIYQGTSGPVWALIALDSMNYPMPVCAGAAVPATRQKYVDRLLDIQRENGGWGISASAGDADVDMTAMALQALANYAGQPKVMAAIEKGLTFLSGAQDGAGGFFSFGAASSESTAQVIVALCALGIDLDDARFVKNGHTLTENLLSYAAPGGGFCHTAGDGGNQMASEQALYALAAIRCAEQGKSLYRMGSAPLFTDLTGHPDRSAIEALAKQGVINGMGDGSFAPDSTMTRAQFCTIVVKALDLMPAETADFSDVPAGTWYAPYVGAAFCAGIVNGVGGGRFAPEGTITRQEAATMIARAAKCCGLDTSVRDAADILARYSDGAAVADWAAETLAFCLSAGLLDADGTAAAPLRPILRCEVARGVYRLLNEVR